MATSFGRRFDATTLSIPTLIIMSLSIQCKYAEYRYTVCDIFIVMLSVAMLSAIMLSVAMLSVIRLSVAMPSAIMLSVMSSTIIGLCKYALFH